MNEETSIEVFRQSKSAFMTAANVLLDRISPAYGETSYLIIACGLIEAAYQLDYQAAKIASKYVEHDYGEQIKELEDKLNSDAEIEMLKVLKNIRGGGNERIYLLCHWRGWLHRLGDDRCRMV